MKNFKIYHSPGLILRDIRGLNKIYYQNQLSPEIIWKHYSTFPSYIKRKYGLTQQEYYNLVVYGDKDLSPKCPVCGINPLRFKNINLGYSYYHNCGSKECRHITCSERNRDTQLKLLNEGKHHFIQDEYKEKCLIL